MLPSPEEFLERNTMERNASLAWITSNVSYEDLSIDAIIGRESITGLDYEALNGSRHLFDLNCPGDDDFDLRAQALSRRDSLFIVIPVTIIYASIFITGTVGNISTCIVITRNKSMHTATNYYLFSLAVSDLLLLVSGLPAEIYLVWYKYSYVFGEGFCVLRGLAAETSTNASVLTITAFTIERYVAICHPFLSQTMSKLSRAIKLILLVWLVAFFSALPLSLQFGILRSDINPEMVMCTVKRTIIEHSFEYSTFLFFVIPMSLITVLYTLIAVKLRKSNARKRKAGKSYAIRHCRHYQGRSSRRVLKMLVAVVVAFFICWAPFHVQRLVNIYGTSSEDHITSNSKWMEFLNLLMTYVSGVFYYVSTTINPILYNIMSNKFRVAFMETLSRSCRVPGLGKRHEKRFYSSLSRSQQRIVGGYNSKTGAPGSIGIAHESTECSRISGKDESPKKMASNLDRQQFHRDIPEKDTIRHVQNGIEVRSNRKHAISDIVGTCDDVTNDKPKVNRKFENLRPKYSCSCDNERSKNRDKYLRGVRDERANARPWFESRGFAVEIARVDGSTTERKWSSLLKRLPSLKPLKICGRFYSAASGELSSDRWNEVPMTTLNEGERNRTGQQQCDVITDK